MNSLVASSVHAPTCFLCQVDSRECRPCAYPGKVLLRPQYTSDFKGADGSVWSSSGLIRLGRTAAATMLASKDMLTVEDVGSSVLPTSTDDSDSVVQGARKAEQLGVDAFSKIWDLAMDGVVLESGKALFLVDGNVGVGHMFEAWMGKRGSLNVPSFFFGCCGSASAAEWFAVRKLKWVANLRRKGDLQIPGHPNPPLTIPEELLQQPPALPKLNVIPARPDLYPQLPESAIAKWISHGVYGAQMKTMLDSIVEEFGPVPQATEGVKRGAGDGQEEPVPKKARVDAERLKPNGEISGTTLTSVALANCKQPDVKLVFQLGDKIWLQNQGASSVTLKQGTFLCGFGKGKFEFDKDQKKDAAEEQQFKPFVVPYDLDGNSKVILAGRLLSLKKVLQDQQKKEPGAAIAYFRVQSSAEQPLSLEKTHSVNYVTTQAVAVPQGEGDPSAAELRALQGSAAALVPLASWKGSTASFGALSGP